MSILNGIANALASYTPSAGFSRAMSRLTNPSPGNSPIPILPLEVSVTGGRSIMGARRTGFLEFQERLIEESIVAAFWLWGVKSIQNLFDYAVKNVGFLKSMKSLDYKIGWPEKIKETLDLSFTQRYALNPETTRKIMGIKTARMGFGVLLNIGIIAFAIPWLIKHNTEWIARTFYKKKHPHAKQPPTPKFQMDGPPREEHAPHLTTQAVKTQPVSTDIGEAGNRPFSQPATPFPMAAYDAGLSPTQSWANPAVPPFYNPWQAQPAWGVPQPAMSYGYTPAGYPQASAIPASAATGGIRFGNGVIGALGRFVEQSDWGHILISDIGVTGGRAISYGKRNPLEAIEVVLRDGVSLYVYLWAIPHLRQYLFNPVAKKLFGADALLEAQVKDVLMKKLLSQVGTDGITADKVKAAFYGVENTSLRQALSGPLQQELRTAPLDKFLELLDKESAVYLQGQQGGQTAGKKLSELVLEHLGGADKALEAHKTLHANDVKKLLDVVEKSGLGHLTTAYQKDSVASAVLQSFRHCSGLNLEGFEKLVDALPADVLPETERAALKLRAAQLAKQDGVDLLNTMLRRSILVAEHSLGFEHEAVTKLETLSEWLEKSAMRKVPVETLVREEAADILDGLTRKKTGLLQKLKSLFGIQPKSLLEQLNLSTEALEKIARGDIYQAKELETLLQAMKNSGNKKIRNLAARLASLNTVIEPGIDVTTSLRSKLQSTLSSLYEAAAQKTGTTAEALALIEHHQKAMLDLLDGKASRLFSLQLDVPKAESKLLGSLSEKGAAKLETSLSSLERKINWLLKGGILNDETMIQDWFHKTGNLPESFREKLPNKLKQALGEMEHYVQSIVKHIGNKAVEGSILEKFLHLSRNTGYLGYLAAAGISAIAIGFGIPKLQYALTKMITGKNEHPGLAALERELEGNDEAPAFKTSSLYNGPPLNRNNFLAFKQAV